MTHTTSYLKIIKNTYNPKNKVDKASTSTKELVVDGFACYSSSNQITHFTSKVYSVINRSLIDSRANGGVEYKDVHTQLTYSNHAVGISGTDKHEISCVSITVAG